MMWCASAGRVRFPQYEKGISHSESWNRNNTVFFISDTFSPWEGDGESKREWERKRRGAGGCRKKNHNDKADTKHRVRINDVKFCLRCSAAYRIFTFSVRSLCARCRAFSVLYTFIYIIIFFSPLDFRFILFYFTFIVSIAECTVLKAVYGMPSARAA